MYTNYAYGVENGLAGQAGSSYNFLITGSNDYTGSTSLTVKNNVSSTLAGNKGFAIRQDSSDNSYIDFRTQIGGTKTLSFRMKDDSNPSQQYPMMVLTDDGNITNPNIYAITIGGRMKASQYYVSQADNRTPISTGMYMGFNSQNTGYVKINKGTGTGGYEFLTINNDGSVAQTNLKLLSAGSVQIPYYSQTTNVQDTETTATALWDATGKIVRGYNQNQRFRSLENRVYTLEDENNSQVPSKINEVIGRLNTLKVWNTKISDLYLPTAPTATPGPTLSNVLPPAFNGTYASPTQPANDTKFGTVLSSATVNGIQLPFAAGGSYYGGAMYEFGTQTGSQMVRVDPNGTMTVVVDTSNNDYIYVTGMAMDASGNMYVIDGSNNVYVYNITTGLMVGQTSFSYPILGITQDTTNYNVYVSGAINPDFTGTIIYQVSWNGSNVVFTQKCTIPSWNQNVNYSYGMIMACDGTYLYLYGTYGNSYTLGKYVLQTGQLVGAMDLSTTIPTDNGNDILTFMVYYQGYLYLGWYKWWSSPYTSCLYRMNVNTFVITSVGQHLTAYYYPNYITFHSTNAYLSVTDQNTGDTNIVKFALPNL